MANTLLNSDIILREALRILHQKLTFIGNVNRQYDKSYQTGGAKDGDTLRVPLPNQYTVTTGATLAVQDTVMRAVTIGPSTQKHVAISFSSKELTKQLNDFSKNILAPAMSVLAANVEADALSMVKDVYTNVDNDGAALTFAKTMLGRKRLNDNLAPSSDRCALLNTQDNVDLVDALKGLFQDATGIKQQYREGMMGRTAGFDFYESTLLSSQLTGTAAKTTTYLVNGAQTTNGDTTLTVDTGATTFKAGDIITVAGCYSVHAESKVSTGVLQPFVVTADYAGGAGAINVSPALYTSGALQNVVAAGWADNVAIVKVGAGASEYYYPSLVFHKDAFAFATADLVKPEGVDFASREVYDGISMRIVRQYDINTDFFPCRVDILYSYKTIRPELACRILSN